MKTNANTISHILNTRFTLATVLATALTKATRKTAPAYKGLKVTTTAATGHPEQHAVTNAPTVSIGGHDFKVSTQPDDGSCEVLLWINKGTGFVTFGTIGEAVRYAIRYLVKHAPVVVKAAVKKAVAKVAKAAKAPKAKPLTDVFPKKTDYKVSVFKRAGLHAKWVKPEGKRWHIAVSADELSHTHATTITTAVWARMQKHGVRSVFASL